MVKKAADCVFLHPYSRSPPFLNLPLPLRPSIGPSTINPSSDDNDLFHHLAAGVRPSVQSGGGRRGDGQRDGDRPWSPHRDLQDGERQQRGPGGARLQKCEHHNRSCTASEEGASHSHPTSHLGRLLQIVQLSMKAGRTPSGRPCDLHTHSAPITATAYKFGRLPSNPPIRPGPPDRGVKGHTSSRSQSAHRVLIFSPTVFVNRK